MNERPTLRQIEAIPFEENGMKMVFLADPARLSEVNLQLSQPAYYILTLMDGSRDVEQLCVEFQTQFGQPVSLADVSALIGELDKAMFLDNQRYHEYKDLIATEFASSETRAAALAGVSYPDDPTELGELLDRLMDGQPAARSSNGVIKAIVVPHIDFRIGSEMMAAGWSEVKETDAELIIILGVGHQLADDFFACIDKDFATPVGAMNVDKKFLNELENNFGEDIYAQQQAHRNEHSIEFQALFYAHLFKGRSDISAAPILLSFPGIYMGA